MMILSMKKQLVANLPAKFASVVMFMMPALALTTEFGMGLTLVLVVLGCAWSANKGCLPFYSSNARPLALIYAGFGGYFLVSLLRMLYFKQGLHSLDGPSHLLFCLVCIGFVVYFRPAIHGLWLGICTGAIASGAYATVERLVYGVDRAVGATHHAITFGDLALALGVMSLCAISEFRKTRLALLPVAGLLCGLLASVLSGSRGGWVALILLPLPLLRYGQAIHGRRIAHALVLIAALCVAIYFLPMSGVAVRMAEAGADMRLYFTHADPNSSVGARLELWKASWMMFSEHPWIGVGRDRFFDTLQVFVQQGKLQPSPALVYSSSHNDVLNFLATGGLLDTSFLLLMYGGPMFFFLSILKKNDGEHRTTALAGLVLVLCFIGFGFTDVMFWLMQPKVFYGMMVCTLIGFCLVPNKPHV